MHCTIVCHVRLRRQPLHGVSRAYMPMYLSGTAMIVTGSPRYAYNVSHEVTGSSVSSFTSV